MDHTSGRIVGTRWMLQPDVLTRLHAPSCFPHCQRCTGGIRLFTCPLPLFRCFCSPMFHCNGTKKRVSPSPVIFNFVHTHEFIPVLQRPFPAPLLFSYRRTTSHSIRPLRASKKGATGPHQGGGGGGQNPPPPSPTPVGVALALPPLPFA